MLKINFVHGLDYASHLDENDGTAHIYFEKALLIDGIIKKQNKENFREFYIVTLFSLFRTIEKRALA